MAKKTATSKETDAKSEEMVSQEQVEETLSPDAETDPSDADAAQTPPPETAVETVEEGVHGQSDPDAPKDAGAATPDDGEEEAAAEEVVSGDGAQKENEGDDRISEAMEASTEAELSDVADPATDPDRPDETSEPLLDAEPDAVEPAEVTEPDPEPGPDSVPEPQPAPAPADAPRASSTPLVVGGVIAGIIGFLVGQVDGIQRALGLDATDVELVQTVANQRDQIDTLTEATAALTERLDTLPPPPPPPEIPEVDLSGVEAGIADLDGRLSDLAVRTDALEKRPVTDNVSDEAIAAYEAELQRLQQAVTDQRAEVEALLAEAREAESAADRRAQVAQARAAASQVVSAIDSGAPFVDALAIIQDADTGEVPAALTGVAESGVATLAALQSQFSGLARAALGAARSEEDTSGNIGAFLQRQLGARSVVPRDGDDPDAVLSRAEAATRSGQLDVALTELDALPDAAKSIMSDWISAARARNEAASAAATLLASLNDT